MVPTMTLPPRVTARDVASACRTAIERFAVLERTHAALFEWLSTAYRDALVGPLDRWPVLLRFSKPAERVIAEAQRTLAELERSARDPRAAFVGHLPRRIDVARVCDERGDVVFAPLDARGATLERRVTALFLADHLTRERWVTVGDVVIYCHIDESTRTGE